MIIFALNILRGTTDQFINGHGLFYDVWAPAVEAIIFILVAIIGGSLWKLEGILLGSIVSLLLIVYGWKPYFLFSKGLGISVWAYWQEVLKFIILLGISLILFKLFNPFFKWNHEISEWDTFILFSLSTGFIFLIIQIILFYIGTNGMKNLIHRFIHKF